jgi:hypothetical protein
MAEVEKGKWSRVAAHMKGTIEKDFNPKFLKKTFAKLPKNGM